MPVRELQYLSTAKLDDFLEPRQRAFTDRAVEAEASVLGTGGRIALGEGAAAELTDAERLERVLAHLRPKCWAHTQMPESCATLGVGAWLEFRGFFRYGAALSDLGMRDLGVFAYASLEDDDCRHLNDEFCNGIQVLLCGSKQHVRDYRDYPPTRMGSGSDWLHEMAADLVAKEARGDTSLPASLRSTNLNDQEFAARSAFSMISHFYRTPGYLNGHARVLCNLPPERLRHRLIVATPLYVEVGHQPNPQTSNQPEPSPRSRWRRTLGFRGRRG
ncbi:SAVMC3_10250 family protein [Streptomyces boninensis]|uniref:SAVMC3_10250 family protein n=1 Tax=Streptomyces boninensis TaxID=2039455 RepID=UPI003B221C7B